MDSYIEFISQYGHTTKQDFRCREVMTRVYRDYSRQTAIYKPSCVLTVEGVGANKSVDDILLNTIWKEKKDNLVITTNLNGEPQLLIENWTLRPEDLSLYVALLRCSSELDTSEQLIKALISWNSITNLSLHNSLGCGIYLLLRNSGHINKFETEYLSGPAETIIYYLEYIKRKMETLEVRELINKYIEYKLLLVHRYEYRMACFIYDFMYKS